MAYINARAWIGKGNAFKVYLTTKKYQEAEVPAELDLVDSMDLELRDSDGAITTISVAAYDADAPMDWWDAALADGVVQFDLGPWAETNAFPSGMYECRLILYSATVNDGRGTVFLSWVNDDMQVQVID